MMSDTQQPAEREAISRRGFIQAIAAGGAALSLSQLAFGQGGVTTSTATANPATSAALAQGAPAILKPGSTETLNVAIIGTGNHGRVLIDACRMIPNLRFKAICDIWRYSQLFGRGKLRAYGHTVNVYEDYREMLAQEKELDAVLIATPDWMHAEQTIACLERGLHVYCEKEMALNLEQAREMVLAARRTGKLLQIGHQRRSNPRYLHARDKIVWGNRLLGRVGQVNAQWNRSKTSDFQMPKKYEVPLETLNKYGYPSMHEFLNWRWYAKFGNGPAADLGSHQLDVIDWFLKAHPKSMMAMGSVDPSQKHEWFNNVMCLLEYETPEGPVNAFYQVLTTSGHGGYFETFMGEEGSIVMCEQEAKTLLRREPNAESWDKWVNAGVLKLAPEELNRKPEPRPDYLADCRCTRPPEAFVLPVQFTKPFHQPHLENFFDAIRHGTPLSCPGEVGYATAVTVLAINDALASGQKIEFKNEDFIVA
jgi:predicted dehydrogenase